MELGESEIIVGEEKNKDGKISFVQPECRFAKLLNVS